MDALNLTQLTLVQHLIAFYDSSTAWQVFERTAYLPACAMLFIFNMVRIWRDYKFCKKYKSDRRPLYKRPRFVINSIMMSIPYVHVWWLMFVAVIMAWNYMFDPN